MLITQNSSSDRLICVMTVATHNRRRERERVRLRQTDWGRERDKERDWDGQTDSLREGETERERQRERERNRLRWTDWEREREWMNEQRICEDNGIRTVHFFCIQPEREKEKEWLWNTLVTVVHVCSDVRDATCWGSGGHTWSVWCWRTIWRWSSANNTCECSFFSFFSFSSFLLDICSHRLCCSHIHRQLL